MSFDEIVVGIHAMMEGITGDPCGCRICQEFNEKIK